VAVPLLHDPVPAVRGAAASALGAVGARASVPELRPLLDDPAPEVAERARHALAALTGRRP